MNLKPCKNMKYFTNSVNGATHVVNAAEKFNNRNLIIQIMRVGFIYTALMLMSFQLLLAIPVRSQSISKVEVKLELRNESLLTAFKKIEQQTPFRFVYRKGELITLPSKNLSASTYTVDQALNMLLKGTDLYFKQVDENILIQSGINQAIQVLPEDNKQTLADITIRGQVTDSNGETLPGVSVKLKGSTIGASTDLDGRYSINIPDKNSVLVFTYIGYLTQEIAVNSGTSINLTLVEDRQTLQEVVVTALGVTKAKRGLGYSVQELRGDEFTEARQNNIANSLTGKIAGLDATQANSGAGGSSRIIIRGNTSLNGNQQPLYVVDGMPINNDNKGAASNSTGLNVDRGDGISSMNPDDIATITVLKGGAAAALYGSQAANGVILITTKKGTVQKGVGIEVTSDSNFGTPYVFPKFQNIYGQGDNGVKPINAAAAIATGRLSFGAKIDDAMGLQFDGVMRPYSYVGAKENIKNFFQTSQNITNTVAFSAGDQNLRMRMSVSDLRSKDQQPNSEYFRKTANLNVTAKMGKNDFITIESSVQYNLVEGRNRPNLGYAELNAAWPVYLAASTVDVRYMEGSDPSRPGINPAIGGELKWNGTAAAINPYFAAYQIGNQDDRQRLIGRASVQANILPNLYIKGTVARDFNYYTESNYVPIGTNLTPLGYFKSGKEQVSKTNFQAIINYNQRFLSKKIGLNLLGGAQNERDSFESSTANGTQWVVPNFYSISNLVNRDLVNLGQGGSGTNSLFGEANLDFKNIFYLTVTGRQDWFSVLNPGFNAIFYPSVGSSFILSDVVKMPKFLNFAKLRSSWAQVGSATVNAGSINQTYTVNTVNSYGVPTLSNPNSLNNPNIRPVTVTTIEGGFEIQMLDSRIGLDVNYYSRNTRNDILTPPISPLTGYAAGKRNLGLVTNKGWEITLSGTPVKKNNFSWDVSYNFGYNQSKIVELAESEGISVLSVGSGIGVSMINAIGLPYSTLRANVIRRDPNGNIVYNKTTGYEDRVLADLGVGNPPFLMGLSNNFRFKRFTLSVDIDSKFGAVGFSNMIQYATRFGHTPITLGGREAGLTVTGVDQAGAPFTKLWGVVDLDTYYNNYGNAYAGEWVYNTDFVKLRRAVLKYNLPVNALKFMRIQSASIGVTGLNLAILYQDKEIKAAGIDPEMQETIGNAQGSQGIAMPRTRNIGFNLNLRF